MWARWGSASMTQRAALSWRESWPSEPTHLIRPAARATGSRSGRRTVAAYRSGGPRSGADDLLLLPRESNQQLRESQKLTVWHGRISLYPRIEQRLAYV